MNSFAFNCYNIYFKTTLRLGWTFDLMSAPFIQVNGQIPRAYGTIHRPRLLQKLQSALEHKLTLISAPPGYGKTTIAAQFAQMTTIPVAWHTVEERERDVPNLHNQCLVALDTIIPGIASAAPSTVFAPSEMAASIANYLRENLTRDIVYILDDVQNLAGSPAAETWLRSLVTMLPKSCHLIVISRILPDLPLTEMIARREVLAIGQQELQFTSDEIEVLTSEMLGGEKPAAELQQIAKRLEGWPAGIILALYPLPPDLESVMLSGGKGPEALFDSLANLMLRTQPSRLRHFLLASSTLTRLTPELCESALQLENAAYWLEEAQNRSLFLSRVAGGLVYHALFRSFLQRQLRTADPELFADLHLRAAHWFRKNNLVDESFDHFLAAGAPQYAAEISEQVAQSYFAQGKTETLLTWGSKLERIGMFIPRLSYTCAMIHTDRYEYEDAEQELEHAVRGFGSRHDDAGLSSVQLQRAKLYLQQGRYVEAAGLAQDLIEDDSSDSASLRARALSTLSMARLYLGDAEVSVSYMQEALPLYRADGDIYALSQALQNLETAYTRLGRLEDAGACLQEVVALRRSLNSEGSLALALNNLGYHYHVCGDYRQAATTFQEGLSIAARVPDSRAESYLLWSLGDLQRDRGSFDEAIMLYNKALELTGGSEPTLRCSLLISASILRRWQTQFADAVTLAEEAYSIAGAHGLALERTVARAMGWAARAQQPGNDLAEAIDQLEVAEKELQSRGARLELLRIMAIRAHLSLLNADPDDARSHMLQAHQISQQAGSSQPMASEILHTSILKTFVLNHIVKRGIFANELKALQDAQAKNQYARQVNASASTTYSLQVLTLGQESIERDGKPVASSEWRATSAREMFLYLYFVGPQTREDFSLAFWPDSPAKAVRSNFHTTLYRARQALGENVVVFQNELYCINPEIDARSDAYEMRTLVGQARLMSSRDARTEDLWRRAADLYRGDFLPSLDADWVQPLRETFRDTYLEALGGLADCARSRGDLRQAIAALKEALEVDPFREDLHRALMTCYAQRGDKKKVAVHLTQLQQFLWQELSIKPSTETLALARTLLS